MLNFAAPRTGMRAGAFALLLSVFMAALLGAAPVRADDTQDAAKLLKAGKHQEALERVNKVLAAKPRDPQARFLKGLIFTEQGNTREAIDIFTKLTQDYPELPEPYNNLAVIYAAQGQYEKARASLEQSIRTHPSYATAYENLGDVYAKLASQAYDKALQLDSANAGAQNKLSLVRELVAPAAVAKPPVAVAKADEAPPAPKPAPEKPAPQQPDAEKAVVAAKPAPEKPAAGASASSEVIAAVNAWAQAWSKKDADAYLAFYAADFKTPGGEPRAEWEKGRRVRITAPKSISVGIASPRVTMSGPNEAKVTFRQTYRSDVLRNTSNKTLVMVKADGRWRIQQERSGS